MIQHEYKGKKTNFNWANNFKTSTNQNQPILIKKTLKQKSKRKSQLP